VNERATYPSAVRKTLERELKLDVKGPFALPQLPGSALPERMFTSTYVDTPVRSLARAGITLRRRVESGTSLWQLKLPRAGDGTERTELEEPGGPGGPPPALERLLVAHVRHGRLEPVATLRTRRFGTRVEEEGRPVADVTVDEVTVLYAERSVDGFTELEIELVGEGKESDLQRLGRTLRDAGAHKSSGKPKLMRVLEVSSPPPPKQDAPVHEHIRHALEVQLAELEAHDPGVRLGADPDDLHQLRVATRRSRALIRATKPLLGDQLAGLAEELKLLGGLLGAVRDLDVLLGHLRPVVARLDADRAQGEELLAALAAERTLQRSVLLEAMETPRYAALLDAFRTAIDGIGVLDAGDGADEIAAHAVHKLRRAAEAIPVAPSDSELHALRIAAKRARYAAELAALGGGKKAAKAVSAFKKLQDTIGEHQDAVVAEERLRGVARVETGVAAGRLIEHERSRKAVARKRYPGVLAGALRRGRKAFS
jgi:CHAD domain-containing protein